ncbi:ribosome maturation factor RimP [Floccifex sp.]|uniref:ribosome maturation factor RimP n=1 Tax=Floccifex sp. TaxID=2815810 RepID=UPI003F011D8F
MDHLKEWIEPLLTENDCRLYELEWLTNQNPPLLRISIEKINGSVDLDTCALCSDVISTMLDKKDWYQKEYMLEVCSPGAERELKTDDQIQQAIGSYVHVKFINPKQGLDCVTGDLIEVNDTKILVSYREKTRVKSIEIDKDNIALIMTAVKL